MRGAPVGLSASCWIAVRRAFGLWQAEGVWQRLHRELLRRLNAAGLIDWSTSVVDGSHIRALLGGSTPGPRRSTVPGPAQSTI